MKRSPQVRLSAAVKRSLLPLSILSLALLLLGSPALATTPIAVDVYQDMESGSNGNALTASIMNTSSHGSQGWSAYSGTMWVSTAYHRDLPGPVICGGVTYNGTGGTRCWKFNNNLAMNCVQLGLSGYTEISVAAFYTTGCTLTYTNGYDTMILWGSTSYACTQTLVNRNGSSGLVLHQHSQIGSVGTNDDPLAISITPLKTYWISMNYDASTATQVVAAYDPDNSYTQIGTTLYVATTYNASLSLAWFGRGDNHGDQTNDLSQGYYDHILVDWSNAAFPIMPNGANDATAPAAPVVRDGTGQDQSIALSTTQLSANWDMAVDNQSGIKGYQYAVGTSQGGTNVVNWTTIKNVRGITKTGLTLTTGQTYYFSVKAINGVGLTSSAANSNGQTVGTDSTGPGAPPAVRDGGWYNYGADIDETPSTTELHCNFDYASDNESGISGYQFAFGTSPGATNTLNWTNLPANMMNGWGTGLSLTQGTRYYASVRAVNNAGTAGTATSTDGQICVNQSDTTPPSAPGTVRDGTGADISTQTSTTQISANWDKSSDNESGIAYYYYCIGTTPGSGNVLNWTITDNLPLTSVTATGLSLTVGQTYYVSVHANNGKGLASGNTTSNGVTVVSGGGNQAPSAPANVRDGTGTDITYTTSNTQLSANWDASTDPDGSVTAYQYAIGTSAGGTQTLNWTTLGNVTTVTKTGLSLTNGQTYYFSVKAVDNQGLAGNATNSNGQTVDNTAPSAPANVRDGTGADISTTNSTTQLSANWDASADAESGISGYQYAIGTSAGGTQTVNWTSLGNVLTVTKTGLTLTNGQTYFFSARAIDGAGLTGNATNSNGQTVQTTDVTPPSAPPAVRDGVGADISTTSSTTQLSANWDASTDNESGISGYQYAIGTSAGGTQTVNFTSLGNVTTVTKTGLTLSVGQTYYFSVKAVNGAGLTGSATNSNGQTVVAVSNVVYFSDNFENWTVHGGAWSSVNGESATHTLDTSTDYAMAGGKCLKITDTDTTATTGASLTKNFSPVISTDIYVRFFMFLPTGYGSANSTCSRRILRVYTNTSNYTVLTLTGDSLAVAEVGGWSGTGPTTISENAWHCVELRVAPPSASTAIQYWIDGTSAGTCTGAFSGSSTFNYMQFGDVALASGTTNGAGTIYWDEVIVANYYIDPSAPSAPATVRDGTGADISTTSSTTQLSANWDAATDADSGISGYQYAIGTSAGGTQTVNWTSLGNVTTVTKTGLTLTVGQTYYVSVRAVNGAGLNSAGTNSNGQTVVVAPITYFSDNFENWTVHGGAWSSISGESVNHTINTSTDYARSGTKSLKITDTDTTATYMACLVENFSPAITTDIYVRFYMFLPTGFYSTNSGCVRRVLRVFCGTNRSQVSFGPNYTVMEEVGAWGAAQGSALSENAWHCLELHVAPPSASTALQYWLDGTSAGTLTANYSASTSFDTMQLGDVSNSGTNGTGTYYFDEVVVSNVYIDPLP